MDCIRAKRRRLQLEESKEAEEEEKEETTGGEQSRNGGKMRGVEDGGQTEVKLLGAVQISQLCNGQEKRESVVGAMTLLPGEKETDWWGRYRSTKACKCSSW